MLNSSHSCTGIYISTCFSPRQGQKFTQLYETKGLFSVAMFPFSVTHPDSTPCLTVILQLWHFSSWFFFLFYTQVFRIAAYQKSAVWSSRLAQSRPSHIWSTVETGRSCLWPPEITLLCWACWSGCEFALSPVQHLVGGLSLSLSLSLSRSLYLSLPLSLSVRRLLVVERW